MKAGARFGTFQLVGMMGAVLQIAIIRMLAGRMPIIVATPVAVEIAVLHNWMWHERITWADRESGSRWRRVAKFHAANGVVSIAGNTFIVAWLAGPIPVWAASLCAIAVCSMLNYWAADRWVWRHN